MLKSCFVTVCGLMAFHAPAAHGQTQLQEPPMTEAVIGAQPGYWQPGGYEGRIGSPYYYSVPNTETPNDSVWDGAGNGSFPEPYASWQTGAATPGWQSWQNYGMGGPIAIDPYTYHFGPGFHRHYHYGHYRFPYYSYRRPWYFPGHPVYNADTNFAW
jgi:hypothetical protein